MSQLQKRVEKLEEAQGGAGGDCPHLPWLTRVFEEVDGVRSEIFHRFGFTPPTFPPCPCGRPRQELHVLMKETETASI
jgi:hypothetical protein